MRKQEPMTQLYRTEPYEKDGEFTSYGPCMEQVGAEALPNEPDADSEFIGRGGGVVFR